MRTDRRHGSSFDETVRQAPAGIQRWAIFGAGLVAAMFSVGGPFDIAITAWIAPVLLLRFSRTTRSVLAIFLIWVVSLLAAGNWSLQVGNAIAVSTLIFTLAFGTVFVIPYVLDRLLAGRR